MTWSLRHTQSPFITALTPITTVMPIGPLFLHLKLAAEVFSFVATKIEIIIDKSVTDVRFDSESEEEGFPDADRDGGSLTATSTPPHKSLENWETSIIHNPII
jgi:hypothetical protein